MLLLAMRPTASPNHLSVSSKIYAPVAQQFGKHWRNHYDLMVCESFGQHLDIISVPFSRNAIHVLVSAAIIDPLSNQPESSKSEPSL